MKTKQDLFVFALRSHYSAMKTELSIALMKTHKFENAAF